MNSKNLPENSGIQAFVAFAEAVGGHQNRFLVSGIEMLVSLRYTVKKIEGPWLRHITKVCFIQGSPCHFVHKGPSGLGQWSKTWIKTRSKGLCLWVLHFKKKYIRLWQPQPSAKMFKNQNQDLGWIDRLCGNSLGGGPLGTLVVWAGILHLGKSPMTPPLPSSCCSFWVSSLPWSFLLLFPGKRPSPDVKFPHDKP